MLYKIRNAFVRVMADPVQVCRHFYRKTITHTYYKVRLRQLGKHSWIGKPLLLSARHISIGDSVYIWPHCRLEAVARYLNKDFTPSVILENGVSIQQNLHLTCAHKITIRENTAIGANVTITDINHPYTDINLPPEQQDIETMEVVIGPDCKIYNNAVILPGVILGRHNVIGANTVVMAGSYPDFSIITGSPGKIVRRFNPLTGNWDKTMADGSFFA